MPEVKSPHAGLTRRSFLKTTAAVAGSATLLGGLSSCASLTTDALVGNTNEFVGVGRCSNYGGCFGCEREIIVRDGKVVNTRPKKDASYGRRPCAKGYAQVNRLYSEHRLKYPMKRVEGTERGAGQWERISWDDAARIIAEKWQSYIDEYGPGCIGAVIGSGGDAMSSYPLLKLGNVMQFVLFDPMYDMAVKYGQWQVAGKPGFGNLNPGNEPFEEDIFNAKTCIVWGANISLAYNQRWRVLLEAQKKGLRVLLIDPNETMAARRADQWFKIRPGSDPALLLGMMKLVIDEGRHDVAFLKSQTVAPLLVRRDNGKFLRMSDLGVAPTQGPVNAYGQPTIIDPLVVWDAAKNSTAELDKATDPIIQGSFEINGIAVDTAFDVFVKHLEDYPIDKVSEITGLTPEEIKTLSDAATDGPTTHLTGLGWQMYYNSWATGAGLSSLLAVTGQVLKPGAGMVPANASTPSNFMATAPTMTFASSMPIEALPDVLETGMYNGQKKVIKSIIVSGQGFVGGSCELKLALEKILPKIDLMVCYDIVMSDTARYSDIILPSAHGYEREAFHSSPMEREIMYSPKFVEPAFEAKEPNEAFGMIAKLMGYGQYFDETVEESINKYVLSMQVFKDNGITYESLQEKPTQRWHKKGFLLHDGVWTTPTKRMEFYAESPQPRFPYRNEEFHPENYHMCTFTEPKEAWPGTDAQKKYPFILYSVRSHFRWHSGGFDDAWFQEIEPEPSARINPDDAAAYDITDGDYVEFFSDRGHAVVRCYSDASVNPGMVCYTKGLQGWQYKAGNFSELSPGYVDPFAVSAIYYDATVDMRKWKEQ